MIEVDAAILRPESIEDRLSDVAFGIELLVEDEATGIELVASSRRATAAATPSRTARSRSGRSNMWEALGWRMYRCCRHAGWMNSPKG